LRVSDEQDELRRAVAEGVPYFGHAMHADQGHDRFRRFPAIVTAVRKATAKERLCILEIGSWAGASIVAWAQACSKNCELVCIDHWQPYLGNIEGFPVRIEMTRAAAAGEIFELFEHNIRSAGVEHLVTTLRGTSEYWLPRLSGSFDIVFIDGDHTCSHVRYDIEKSLPLVSRGGVICGDDLERQLPEVLGTVFHSEALRTGEEFIAPDGGPGYHPGVTQAVHDLFGEVPCYDGLWVKHV
jgi:Methyltransferase domain